MTDEKKVFAEWYSLGSQELAQGTVETRAMLVPGAGVLVQIEARTAGGRNALTAQWLPGVVIYEGRLVGGEWSERLIQEKIGGRPIFPVPPVKPVKPALVEKLEPVVDPVNLDDTPVNDAPIDDAPKKSKSKAAAAKPRAKKPKGVQA
jgi:hypothetical protein